MFSTRYLTAALALWLGLGRALSASAEEKALVIPEKPDPPFVIDGDLSDWNNVPNEFSIQSGDHVTYGKERWKGPRDLSFKGKMAWRQNVLYLAVDVTDDVISQHGRGEDAYRGDHVILFLDFAPGKDPLKSGFGEGQWQFGFSPGNFANTGDPTKDIPPEVIVFNPQGKKAPGIEYAAKRTPNGYRIEAAIPASALGIAKIDADLDLNGEIAVSDCDSVEPAQEKLMTLDTRPWKASRGRLIPFILGNAAGKGTPPTRSIPLAAKEQIPPGQSLSLAFQAPPIPQGKEAYLFLRGRIPFAFVGGYQTGALVLEINGQRLDGARLSNRPRTVTRNDNTIETLVASTGEASVYLAPDFQSADTNPAYGLKDGYKASEFEFRVTDLLKSGENKLTVSNKARVVPDFKPMLEVADVSLALRVPPPPPRPLKPAPTGALPAIKAATQPKTEFQVEEVNPSTLKIGVAKQTFLIESFFSTPDGQWNRASNAYFEHKREIVRRDEAVIVRDTFINRGDQDIPVMQKQVATVAGGFKTTDTAGQEADADGSMIRQDPGNPSVYGNNGVAGVGLLALNDVFRVHVNCFGSRNELQLKDDSFVLAKGKSYTSEWAIIPTGQPDPWQFVNAARRLLDANFTLPDSYAFLRADPKPQPPDHWPDERVGSFIRNKGATVVTSSNEINGGYRYGTDFLNTDLSSIVAHFAQIRRAAPGTKCILYYHCFIDHTPTNVEKFKADRVLKPDGTQVDYGGLYSADKIFLPTLENGFGRETGRGVDKIFNEAKADGVFWDEFEYSVSPYHYGEPWDGCSGDIDPNTFKLLRKKSSVTLLSQDFRLHHAKDILRRGVLWGNGAPSTGTMAALKFPRFTETGTISNCAKMQLYSPIALGDHLTERNGTDAYEVMLEALDYGCLYVWYSDRVEMDHPTLASHMFPITPVEIHKGYVLGKERIVTKESGLFGFGDASKHRVLAFDAQGKPVENFKAPLVAKEGESYSEIRLPEKWSAIIVKE